MNYDKAEAGAFIVKVESLYESIFQWILNRTVKLKMNAIIKKIPVVVKQT